MKKDLLDELKEKEKMALKMQSQLEKERFLCPILKEQVSKFFCHTFFFFANCKFIETCPAYNKKINLENENSIHKSMG